MVHILCFALAALAAGVQAPSSAASEVKPAASPALVSSGQSQFLQQCAFCHGRDTGGGETGPDLTRSQLVAEDVAGNKIGAVVRNGRPEKGMPRFNVSDQELAALVAFIRDQKTKAESQKGGRRGVDVADLQTGNVAAGLAYFKGACASCHSGTGDLEGVARRYQGLKLEQRMLYPSGATSHVTVTLPSGQNLTGKLAYLDEFTIGLQDDQGWYHSWPAAKVRFTVDAPADAHIKLLEKYSDDDVHNLMAYLQTLR